MKIARGVGWCALAAAAFALAAACTPADVTDLVESNCQDYAYAYCEKLQGCSSTAIEMRFGDVATCSAWQKASCVAQGNAPSSAATPAWQASCTQALAGWSCPDFVYSQNPPLACQTPPGPLANGMPCSVKAQCQSDYCGQPAGQACGTCGPPPAIGASCAELPCATSDVCVGTPLVCAIYSQTGGSCGEGVPCVDGLNCVGASATSMGTCQPAVQTQGMPCVFTGAGCDVNAGLACNAATSTCETVRISPPGGTCGVAGDQQAYCAMSICTRGACVAEPRLGAPCDLGGPSCLNPGRCVVADGGTSGTCQVRGATACQ